MTNFEELLFRFRFQLAFLLFGVILLVGGLFIALHKESPEFEIVDGASDSRIASEIVVEVSGAVVHSGVYKLANNARIEDAISAAGGVDEMADIDWIEKYLNRAAYVSDGQKIYIPWQGEGASASNLVGHQSVSNVISSETASVININTASKSQLEDLSGIGPVYAQKIIDNRPYSSVEDLLTKKAVTQKIYDENFERFSVY